MLSNQLVEQLPTCKSRAPISSSPTSSDQSSQSPQFTKVLQPADNSLDQIPWDQLKHLEAMVNGSRCTIYTAFYQSTPVVVKVMRKDVQDKETVRQVLRVGPCRMVVVDEPAFACGVYTPSRVLCGLHVERTRGVALTSARITTVELGLKPGTLHVHLVSNAVISCVSAGFPSEYRSYCRLLSTALYCPAPVNARSTRVSRVPRT